MQKKYFGSILIIKLCLFHSFSFAQNIAKQYYSFDLNPIKLTLLDSNTVELTRNGKTTYGKWAIVNHELNFHDTVSNANALSLGALFLYDSGVYENKVKVCVNRNIFLRPVLTSYSDNGIHEVKIIDDTLIYLSSEIDSFYLSFLGLDAKSRMYLINRNLYNTIRLRLSYDIVNSLSLGDETAYILRNGEKLNFYYYENGQWRHQYLYTSERALIKDKRRKIRLFKKDGIWND